MTDFTAAIESIAKRAEQAERPGDYRQDGLLYCGNCQTPKECRVTIGGRVMQVGCLCKCQAHQWDREREEERRRQAAIRVRQLRAECIQDRSMEACRFEAAEPSTNLDRCRRYVDAWERVRKDGVGLLFYGPPGGGKTFAAACIANALIDKAVPVMMTSFPKILAAAFDDRAEMIGQLGRYPLLVIDDLGVERESEYALEQIYTVVDERVKSGKPMIITTNLALSDIQQPRDMAHARVYGRITAATVPMFFQPAEFRKAAERQRRNIMAEIFGG